MELPPSAAPLHALNAESLPPNVLGWVRERGGNSWRAGGAGNGGCGGNAGNERNAGNGGETSAYLYDVGVAAANAHALRAALPEWAEVFYAMKANSFPPVLDALLTGHPNPSPPGGAPTGVHGFDVASAREVALAVDATHRLGLPGSARMVASGPGKSVSLLAALVDAGVEVVNVESVGELYRLNQVAARAGRVVDVALRVNPARVPLAGSLSTGSLQMGGTPSAFGIPEADVPTALAVATRLPWLDVVGFHAHAVSHNLDALAHLAYVQWCLDFAARTAARAGIDLRMVDVGGGFGVPFEPDRRGERPFDLDTFADGMARMPTPYGVRVVFEPGRWLVADCGWYAAEVTDVKHAYGTDFAVLRGGIHHFQLPTSWEIVHNFAVVGVDDWRLPGPRPGVADGPVTLVGELCTPEDTLARDVTVRELRAGDVVVFPMAGAYGYEFAMHNFLGHPLPDRVVLPPHPHIRPYDFSRD